MKIKPGLTAYIILITGIWLSYYSPGLHVLLTVALIFAVAEAATRTSMEPGYHLPLWADAILGVGSTVLAAVLHLPVIAILCGATTLFDLINRPNTPEETDD